MASKKEFTELNTNVHRFFKTMESLDSCQFLLLSDVHYDSPHCERGMLEKHLNQAKKQGAYIFIFGDWFDVMGCYKDPRSKAAEIRSQYLSQEFSYLDMIIEDSIAFLKPYANNILLLSEGNHETAIWKRHDTNPLKRLVDGLQPYNQSISRGRYSGYINFKLSYAKGKDEYTKNLHYHHGFGGNAKRSKGMLDAQIEAMKYPDAHILCRGHDHQKWHDPSTTKQRLSAQGNIYWESIEYVKTGSYKAGLNKGEGGFEVERNFMPTKLGGWWLNMQLIKGYGIEQYLVEAK